MISPDRRWIEFTETPVRIASRDQIYASLNSRGVFLINRKCFEEMGRPTYVVLLLDPERSTIGLRPTGPETPYAFKLYKKGKYDNRLITAMRFVRRHDIRIAGTVRFPTARIEHGVLILELKFRVPVTYKPTPK